MIRAKTFSSAPKDTSLEEQINEFFQDNEGYSVVSIAYSTTYVQSLHHHALLIYDTDPSDVEVNLLRQQPEKKNFLQRIFGN